MNARTGRPRSNVLVLPLDRWGKVLVQRTAEGTRLIGGPVNAGESPDRAALRVCEAETGALLDDLRLYRVLGPDDLSGLHHARLHVYYDDPDLPAVGASSGSADGVLSYISLPPGDADAAGLPVVEREVLRLFAHSPAYRALFH